MYHLIRFQLNCFIAKLYIFIFTINKIVYLLFRHVTTLHVNLLLLIYHQVVTLNIQRGRSLSWKVTVIMQSLRSVWISSSLLISCESTELCKYTTNIYFND